MKIMKLKYSNPNQIEIIDKDKAIK